MRKNQGSLGFTLLEVIVALIVLSVAYVPLSLSFGNIVKNTVLPGILNTAAFLAQQEMERIEDKRYSEILAEAPTAYPAPFAAYSYEVLVTPVPTDLADDALMTRYKQVEVIVRHNTIGSVNLKAVMTNN